MEVPYMHPFFSGRKLRKAFYLVFSILIFSTGTSFGAGGGEGGGLTVIPDWTVLIQMANFLFLIWVLNIILYKPIRKVLLQRKEKITGLEESIEAFQKDVQDKEEAYASGIREARFKGLQEKDQLLNLASEEEKKIIGQINDKAQAELAKVREDIAKDAEAVRQSLLSEVDEFAKAIGQKILGRAV